MNPNQATVAQWPALYHPSIELHNFEHQPAIQPKGLYLYNAHVIFQYTLYWTLCFYAPLFLLCGIFAFLNISFPPKRGLNRIPTTDQYVMNRLDHSPTPEMHPMLSESSLRAPSTRPARATPRLNEHRSRVTFAIIVLFIYLFCALAGSVLAAVIGGYILAGVYDAASYNMSTWIPMIYALIQSLVGLLGLWSSVIDVI